MKLRRRDVIWCILEIGYGGFSLTERSKGEAGTDNAIRVVARAAQPILDAERKFHWPLGRHPDDHPSLSDLGL